MSDINPNFNEGVSVSEKITQEINTNGISIAESIAQTLELKENGASQSASYDIDLKIGDSITFNASASASTTTGDATTDNAADSDTNPDLNSKIENDELNVEELATDTPLQSVLNSPLVEGAKFIATEPDISIADILELVQPALQEANLIPESIQQLKDSIARETTTHKLGVEASAKVGDATFTASDNSSYTSSPFDQSFENHLNASAEYDNGFWYDKLNIESNIKGGRLGGFHADGKISHELGTKFLSLANSISGEFHTSAMGVSAKLANEGSINIGKNVTISGSDTTSFDANVDDVSLSRKLEGSAGYDNGVINGKVSANAEGKASINEGLVGSVGASHTAGINNVVSQTKEVSQKAIIKDGKTTTEVKGALKNQLGNDNVNINGSESVSAGVVSDGSTKLGVEKGAGVKAGPIEFGGSANVNKTVSEQEDKTEVGFKVNSGVQMTKGSKLTSEVKASSYSTEKKETKEESKDNEKGESKGSEQETVHEDGFNIETKTRIEVDYNKASGVEVAFAGAFNAVAATTEFFTNEAMKSSSTSKDSDNKKEPKKENNEDQNEKEKQAEKEAQQQKEQQAEQEAKQQAESYDYSYGY